MDSAEVVELECVGLRDSGDLGSGGRSATARETGRDDDEQATASASTRRMPWSVSVHLSRLAST